MTFATLLQPVDQAVDLAATDAFADLRAHVARLDLPEGEAVDWAYVEQRAHAMLKDRGKDLLLATYAAFAPLALGTQQAPHHAIAFITTFMDTFWDTMTPPCARPRARANVMAWFIGRLGVELPRLLAPLDATQRRLTQTTLVDLSARLEARLGAQAPKLTPLLRAASNMAAVPTQSPARHAWPQTPQLSPRAQASDLPHRLASPGAAQALVLNDEASTPASCAALGKSICLWADRQRRAQPTDPKACRLWRVGLWLNVHTAPALLGDVTRIAPIGPAHRARLAHAQKSQAWSVVLDNAYDAMLAHPLCLDLQHAAAMAHRALGPAHAGLAELIREETAALCRRLPALCEMRATDGTPLASPATRAWLALQAPIKAAAVRLPTGPSTSRAVRQFKRQLGRAQRALQAGEVDVAEALLCDLARRSDAHQLRTWDPPLALAVALSHLEAVRQQPDASVHTKRAALRRWAVLAPQYKAPVEPV